MVDFTAKLAKPASVDEVNHALQTAAQGVLKGVLDYCTQPLVSVDFKGNPHSSIVDSLITTMVGADLVKVLSWYDNEWGYCNRMVEVALDLL